MDFGGCGSWAEEPVNVEGKQKGSLKPTRNRQNHSMVLSLGYHDDGAGEKAKLAKVSCVEGR